MNIKQNKGIGLADAIIAVVILMIFTGVIASVSYNIYIQSHFIKRNEQATNYIVELFEYAQGLEFENPDSDEDLNSGKLVKYITEKYDNDIVKAIEGEYSEDAKKLAAYTIFINVKNKYPDYIKQIDITVLYKLGGKNNTVSMSTLINK